jgi:glycosyltransferase involved in cell wall biosynthesis
VEDDAPELVIAIGIGKLFPSPILLPPGKRGFHLVGLFGNNRFNYRDQKLVALQKRLVQRLFKDPHYDKAVRNCDRIWCYTPETEQVLSAFTRGKRKETLREKVRLTSLGFDPERFYFDESERKEGREAWGVEEDATVFLTATRLVPSKKLDTVIEAFEAMMARHPGMHYVLIGSSGDDHSRALKERMERSEFEQRFHLLPFQREHELRRSFNAADIGIWTAASISIQQGMGTGLPMLLPDSSALSHLLQDPDSGFYYRQGELEEGLEQAMRLFAPEAAEKRKARMKANRERFSDRRIARDLVERSIDPC